MQEPEKEQAQAKSAAAQSPSLTNSVLRCILIVSPLMYIASYGLPCITVGNKDVPWFGWECLTAGFFGLFQTHFEVLANLFYVCGIVATTKNRYKPAAILSIMAILFGLETLSLYWLGAAVDEGGKKYFLISLDVGYYFWMGSMVFLLVFSIYALKSDKMSVQT